MASIRQRKNRPWQVRFYEGGRRTDPERSHSVDTHAEAVVFKGMVDAAG